MLNLAEFRKRPALLADWLPWAGLVAPGVVLNKDGSFQRSARFRGPDLDSATPHELIASTARLNNALKRLGSGWALFVHRYKPELPSSNRKQFLNEAVKLGNCGHNSRAERSRQKEMLLKSYIRPAQATNRRSIK